MKWIDDKVIGTLIVVDITAWVVLAVLGIFGVMRTHDAQSAGTVLGYVTVIGAALVALVAAF
jgi:hypothetical protein